MPLQFTVSLTGRIILVNVLITALICGIYLTEQFVPLLETALRFAFGGLAFSKLLFLAIPGVVDFALPLAALCVVYFAILNARESREFLVLSAAGAGSTHLAITVLVAGLVAAGTSLAVSGFLKPAASFAFRSTLAASVNEVLSKGIPAGSFYTQSDRVLYSRHAGDQPQRVMRLFEFEGERLDRVVVSDCARMRVEHGAVLTETCSLKGYRIGNGRSGAGQADSATPPCTVCVDNRGHVPVTVVSSGTSQFAFAMDEFFATPVRNRARELTLPELLAADGDQFRSFANAELAAARVLSALACMASVILALLTVAFTTERTRIFALPAASILMMGLMVLANSQAWLLEPASGRSMLLLKLAAIAAASVPLTVVAARLAYGRLVAPALVRP